MSADFNIQTILVAPLDWGLGHATRCISLIHNLHKLGFRVLIATDGPQEILLKKEFPQNQFLRLTGYKVRYSRSRGWLPIKILQQLPAIYGAVKREHQWLNEMINQYNIDLVISDNRYGLWSSKIPTVFITHQLTIKAPYQWLESMIQRVNYRYINRFTACWIPDVDEAEGLAGILSHPKNKPKIPISYLGLLTRFERKEKRVQQGITVLLSGPEPQRSLLEEKIIEQAIQMQQPITLVRGLPSATEQLTLPSFITLFNHLEAKELENLLIQSELVITRSGYSSLMDLMQLQVKAVLVPTPGQTEQEYLALMMSENSQALQTSQEDFDLALLINKSQSFNYVFPSLHVLKAELLEKLLKQLDRDSKNKGR